MLQWKLPSVTSNSVSSIRAHHALVAHGTAILVKYQAVGNKQEAQQLNINFDPAGKVQAQHACHALIAHDAIILAKYQAACNKQEAQRLHINQMENNLDATDDAAFKWDENNL